MKVKAPNAKFWNGKRVLITGHTGFKGAWLTIWLRAMGAQITGVSLYPNTEPSLFSLARVDTICNSNICDIRDYNALKTTVIDAEPEVIFHLAAQPLVRLSYQEPLDTISTNIMGTAHILDIMRYMHDIKVALMITTDKVYKNNSVNSPYIEDDMLGGYDPYSASKAASEIIIDSYRDSFLFQNAIALASARAGNVLGGGDWAEERLIPDAIRAWQSGATLKLRYPHAIRPWQHVLEALYGYIILAEQLWINPQMSGAFNFGPSNTELMTVQQVVNIARKVYGKGEVSYDDLTIKEHESSWLSLDITKAKKVLGFKPAWDLTTTIKRTLNWYLEQQNGIDPLLLCKLDIAEFEKTFISAFNPVLAEEIL